MYNKNAYEALCSISSAVSKLINRLFIFLTIFKFMWLDHLAFFSNTRDWTYGLTHPTHTLHRYIISLECFSLLFWGRISLNFPWWPEIHSVVHTAVDITFDLAFLVVGIIDLCHKPWIGMLYTFQVLFCLVFTWGGILQLFSQKSKTRYLTFLLKNLLRTNVIYYSSQNNWMEWMFYSHILQRSLKCFHILKFVIKVSKYWLIYYTPEIKLIQKFRDTCSLLLL